MVTFQCCIPFSPTWVQSRIICCNPFTFFWLSNPFFVILGKVNVCDSRNLISGLVERKWILSCTNDEDTVKASAQQNYQSNNKRKSSIRSAKRSFCDGVVKKTWLMPSKCNWFIYVVTGSNVTKINTVKTETQSWT